MERKSLFIAAVLIFISSVAFAQNEKRWLKQRISSLSGSSMHGRGYVNKGGDRAASFIRRNLKNYGVLPFDTDSTYYQKYTFPVNTFPGNVSVKINRKELEAGKDYLIDAGSKPFHIENMKLKKIDLGKIKDSVTWANVKNSFQPNKAYYLKNSDTPSKYLKFSIRSFANQLPRGYYIVPKHGKLTWLVRTDTIQPSIVYVEDTVLPRFIRRATVHVESKFEPAFKTQNVIGYIPGTEKPDSFIVFTAHYDHLGRMGRNTVFPGAHDNASGTAMVMYLANYFAQHPQRYSVAFMLFSGEEAGLIGSKHYVKNPVFPLEQIRFVVNLDMTGDATNGITVVNGDTRPAEFALLEKINSKKSYLPKINKREQTANSDHYSFSQEGVPAVFIYGNGTKGFYHDIYDQARELSLQNIDNLARLLIDFTAELNAAQ